MSEAAWAVGDRVLYRSVHHRDGIEVEIRATAESIGVDSWPRPYLVTPGTWHQRWVQWVAPETLSEIP